jgi:hypothetical protein
MRFLLFALFVIGATMARHHGPPPPPHGPPPHGPPHREPRSVPEYDYYDDDFISMDDIKQKMKDIEHKVEDAWKKGVKIVEEKGKNVLGNLRNQACDMCTQVVGTIKANVDKEEPVVQKKVDALCQKLPSMFSSKCSSFVDKELPALQKMVDNEMTTQEICTNVLHVCTSAVELAYWPPPSPSVSWPDRAVSFNIIDDIKDKIKSMEQGLGDKIKNGIKKAEDIAKEEMGKLKAKACDVCTNLVKTVDDNLDKDEPTLEANLKAYCQKYAPSFMVDSCVTLVTKELPALKDKVENKMTPQEVCQTTLHLCTADPTSFGITSADYYDYDDYDLDLNWLSDVKDKVSHAIHSAEDGIKKAAAKLAPMLGPFKALACPICKKGVAKAKTTLEGKEGDINAKAEELCKKLPSMVQGICVSTMEKYLPLIEQALENNVDDNKICHDIIHLC